MPRARSLATIRLVAASLLPALIASSTASAGPPPGPFGPIQQTYEIPANAARVIYVAPEGNAAATGDAIDNPTSIEAAFQRATNGDAIILRGGLYRIERPKHDN